MWPKYLDLAAEECAGILRRLELVAYSDVVTALRAQGELTKERRKVLQDLSAILNISIERHKAEVRRAVNDELLNTVAASVCGPQSETEWAREGRRIIPLLRRATPITKFTAAVNAAKAEIETQNGNLLPPASTQTPKKSRKHSGKHSKGPSNSSPPKLEDIVVKAKDEEGKSRLCVMPPPVSFPKPPASYRMHSQDYFGGDVVVLPSGMAIRVMPKARAAVNDKITPTSKKSQQNRRKRKTPSGGGGGNNECESTTFEILRHSVEPIPPQFFPQQLYQLQHPQRMPPPPPPLPHVKIGVGQQPIFTTMPPPPPSAIHAFRTPINLGTAPVPIGKARRASTGKVRKVKDSEKVAKKALRRHLQGHPVEACGPPRPLFHQPNSSPLPVVPISSHMIPAQLKALPAAKVEKMLVAAISSQQPMPQAAAKQTTTTGKPAAIEPEDSSRSSKPQPKQPHIIRHQPVVLKSQLPALVQPAGFGCPPSASTVVVPMSENGNRKSNTAVSFSDQGELAFVSSNGSVMSSRASPKPAPIKLKEAASTGVTLAPSMITTSNVAATLTAGGMKVIPAGARILPKPGSASMGLPAPPGTPIYMVATNAGQNLVRVAKTIPPVGSVGNTVVGTSTTQRVVTLSATALRTPGIVTLSSSNSVCPGIATFRPGVHAQQIVRGLQPRCLTAAMPGTNRAMSSTKPSVIVVQRGPHGSSKNILTKDIPTGQRIITGAKATLTGASKPLVIVTKPTATPLTTTSTLANASSASKPLPGQGNVIVLDLSQEQVVGSPMLNDILQASGIISEGGVETAGCGATGDPHRKATTRPDKPPRRGKAITVKAGGNQPAASEQAEQNVQHRPVVPGKRAVERREQPPIDIVSVAFKDADIDPNQMSVDDEVTDAEHSASKFSEQQTVTKVVLGSVKTATFNAQDTPSTGESIEDLSAILAAAPRALEQNITIEEAGDSSRTIGEVGDEVVGEDD